MLQQLGHDREYGFQDVWASAVFGKGYNEEESCKRNMFA